VVVAAPFLLPPPTRRLHFRRQHAIKLPCPVVCAPLAGPPALLRMAAHACRASASSSFDLAAPERRAGLLNAGFAQGDP